MAERSRIAFGMLSGRLFHGSGLGTGSAEDVVRVGAGALAHFCVSGCRRVSSSKLQAEFHLKRASAFSPPALSQPENICSRSRVTARVAR